MDPLQNPTETPAVEWALDIIRARQQRKSQTCPHPPTDHITAGQRH